RNGGRVFSGAYIMPPGKVAYSFKHEFYLRTVDRMMRERVPAKLMESRSMSGAFEILRGYAGIGDFLAYQFLIDLNYSKMLNFSEMEFVVPGPGAREGILKCFKDTGGLSGSDIIRMV